MRCVACMCVCMYVCIQGCGTAYVVASVGWTDGRSGEVDLSDECALPVWSYMHLYFTVLYDTAWRSAGPIAGYGLRTWDGCWVGCGRRRTVPQPVRVYLVSML